MSGDNPIACLDLMSMQRLARVNKISYKYVCEAMGKKVDYGQYVYIPQQDPMYETIMENFRADIVTNASNKEIKEWIQSISDS